MDDVDRAIVNALQDGIAPCERPFLGLAQTLGLDEAAVVERLGRLLDDGVLSRFGPMYHAERMGGALTLCAMRVPRDRLDAVVERVNALPEVAHNYEREHELNVWFVLATDDPARVRGAVERIERETGIEVLDLPKEAEFYVGLRLEA